MNPGEYIDISIEDERMILEKSSDICVFCSTESAAIDYKGLPVCRDCAVDLGRRARVVIDLSEKPQAHDE